MFEDKAAQMKPSESDDTAPAAPSEFSYEAAFSRTLGWITRDEQARLRTKRVAIGGLGGVGGAHAITLARLGVGRFRLADFDHFDYPNFNRQFGATVGNVGRSKVDVIVENVRGINPEAMIDAWARPIRVEDASAFLADADIYVDSIDFFTLDVRRALFAEARVRGIPALTAAPVGTGAAWIVFLPDGMSFETYFGFSETDLEDNYLRFLVGLAPRALHLPFLVDRSFVDFKRRKAPSTPMGIVLCAGVAGTLALRLLLDRGGIKAAPWFHQFDASAGKMTSGRSWLGGANPVRRLKCAVTRRMVASADSAA